MGVTINGVALTKMTHNGVEVKRWVHNGVEVFASSKPFYWIKDKVVQDGFPANYQTITLNPNMAYLVLNSTLTGLELLGAPSANTGYIGQTLAVETKGNKNIEILLSTWSSGGSLGVFKVGGVDCLAQAKTGVINLDISNMTEVDIYINTTTWAGGNHFGVSISSIRFY